MSTAGRVAVGRRVLVLLGAGVSAGGASAGVVSAVASPVSGVLVAASVGAAVPVGKGVGEAGLASTTGPPAPQAGNSKRM